MKFKELNRFVALACFVWSILSAKAQPVDIIKLRSLQEAWDLAVKENPNIDQYLLQKASATFELKTARSNLIPTISGNVSGQRNFALATTLLPGDLFGYTGETIEAQFGQNYNYNAGITVSRTIGWQSFLEINIAQNNILLSDAQHDAFEQSLKQQVALYYYSILITQKALILNREDSNIAERIANLTDQKFNEGSIDATIKNQALINKNSIILNEVNNRSLLSQCYQQLYLLLGIDAMDSLDLEASLMEKLDDFPLDLMLESNKTVIVKEAQLENANANLKLRKAAYVPSLSASLYLGKQQFRNDFGLGFGDDVWSDYQYLNLGLSIPIFSGFSNRNELAVARINLEMAQQQLKEELRRSAINDQQITIDYQNAILATKAAYANFLLYAENQQLTYQKYEEGLISLDSYFQTFENYLQAEQAYLAALSGLYSQYSFIISRQSDK